MPRLVENTHGEKNSNLDRLRSLCRKFPSTDESLNQAIETFVIIFGQNPIHKRLRRENELSLSRVSQITSESIAEKTAENEVEDTIAVFPANVS